MSLCNELQLTGNGQNRTVTSARHIVTAQGLMSRRRVHCHGAGRVQRRSAALRVMSDLPHSTRSDVPTAPVEQALADKPHDATASLRCQGLAMGKLKNFFASDRFVANFNDQLKGVDFQRSSAPERKNANRHLGRDFRRELGRIDRAPGRDWAACRLQTPLQ